MWPKKNVLFFYHLPKQKMAIESEPVGAFQFCLDLWEALEHISGFCRAVSINS